MRNVLICVFVLVASPAFAKSHHHHRFHRHPHQYSSHHHRHHGVRYAHHSTHGDSRPSAWCGWFLRQMLGVTDTALNLAANWAHWGRPTEAHVGAVVVWPHHVGKIVGGSPGHWAVLSGNDGHRVRTRVRSTAGAIAFRE